jgi:Trk-type K+ transport system membrane component
MGHLFFATLIIVFHCLEWFHIKNNLKLLWGDQKVTFIIINVFSTSFHLDLNSKHGNINQVRDSHGSQYVAAAACRATFQNGATVAELVYCGGSISSSFSAYQRSFSSVGNE